MMLKNIHNPSTCYCEIHAADFPEIKAVSNIELQHISHFQTIEKHSTIFPYFYFTPSKGLSNIFYIDETSGVLWLNSPNNSTKYNSYGE